MSEFKKIEYYMEGDEMYGIKLNWEVKSQLNSTKMEELN